MKKFKKRDLYLMTAIFNLTWFCIAVLIINAKGNDVSPELIIGWFAAWTAELAAIAKIKITKKKEVEE